MVQRERGLPQPRDVGRIEGGQGQRLSIYQFIRSNERGTGSYLRARDAPIRRICPALNQFACGADALKVLGLESSIFEELGGFP